MASSCKRLIQRSSLSSIKSALRSSAPKSPTASATSTPFALPTRSSASPLRRLSLSRSPSELGCVQSLLPLHSVVAAARMTSCLSTTSKSCRSLSQAASISSVFYYKMEHSLQSNALGMAIDEHFSHSAREFEQNKEAQC